MRANKIQENQRIYVKDFIGDTEKWQEAIFQCQLNSFRKVFHRSSRMNSTLNVYSSRRIVFAESKHIDFSRQIFIRLAEELRRSIDNFEQKKCFIVLPGITETTKKFYSMQKIDGALYLYRVIMKKDESNMNKSYIRMKNSLLKQSITPAAMAPDQPSVHNIKSTKEEYIESCILNITISDSDSDTDLI